MTVIGGEYIHKLIFPFSRNTEKIIALPSYNIVQFF